METKKLGFLSFTVTKHFAVVLKNATPFQTGISTILLDFS